MLGWLGAVTVLMGVVFLLLIAAARGWLTEEVRALMAAATSIALLAGGASLHERRGRAKAALAATAAGIAGFEDGGWGMGGIGGSLGWALPSRNLAFAYITTRIGDFDRALAFEASLLAAIDALHQH